MTIAALEQERKGARAVNKPDGTELFERMDAVKGIDLARLRELAEAEREGRAVVLPKVGETLFYAPYPKSTTGIDGELLFLRNTGDGTGVVRRVVVAVMFDNWAAQVPLKRTWKTKAEAEVARALAATEPKGDADA